MAGGYHASWPLASVIDEIRVLIAFVFHHWQNTLSSEVHDVKLSITLKQSDADGFGGELLETLGMNRALRDTKTFVRELAVTELLDKFTDSLEEEDDDGEKKVGAKAGSFTGRRRRRRRTRPTDFLLYEDNSLYALPYLEPLTDRGIIPLRVSLRTDSTVALTPINASAVSAADDDEAEADSAFIKNASRLVNESIDRIKRNGSDFKFISDSSKRKVIEKVATMLKEDSHESATVVSEGSIDGLVSQMVNASSDDELATAALDLARRALLDDNVDPQVLAALKAAAFTLSNG